MDPCRHGDRTTFSQRAVTRGFGGACFSSSVVGLQVDLFEVTTTKLPVRKNGAILGEIVFVPKVFIATERNIELALSVETAESVVASAIQIVEEASGLLAIPRPTATSSLKSRRYS